MNVAEATLNLAAERLAFAPLRIEFHVERDKAIPGWGVGGYAGSAQLVQVYLDPAFADDAALTTLRLPRVLAHELHHAARWHGPGYGRHLLAAMVSEGLADQFALELFGGPRPPWLSALTAGQALKLWGRANRQLEKKDYSHSRWFHGTHTAIPNWSAYTLGFMMVDRYMAAHPAETAASLATQSADAFRPAWQDLKRVLRHAPPAPAGDESAVTVQVHGSLRAMMHEGAVGPQVELAQLTPDSQLFALGAVAGLQGEITILDGNAWLSRVSDAETVDTTASPRPEGSAALLVSARVPGWTLATVDRDIPFEDLDERIAAMATAAGLDSQGRVPFLIQGTVRQLHWHVIDGRRLPPGPSSHQAHQQAAVRLQRQQVKALLLGFYSPRDQGVFTHHDSRTHLHCVLARETASGHVDGVLLPAGTLVGFPDASAGDRSGRPHHFH